MENKNYTKMRKIIKHYLKTLHPSQKDKIMEDLKAEKYILKNKLRNKLSLWDLEYIVDMIDPDYYHIWDKKGVYSRCSYDEFENYNETVH